MTSEQVHRAATRVIVVLSVIALLTVLSGYLQRPQPDEGTSAHIFQIDIAALALAMLLFLVTANWKQPLRSARPMAIPAIALTLAFGALYYLEHYYYR